MVQMIHDLLVLLVVLAAAAAVIGISSVVIRIREVRRRQRLEKMIEEQAEEGLRRRKEKTMDLTKIISILSDIRSGYNCFDPGDEERYRGLSEAIKMLSAQTDLQPNLQPTCNKLATDCISRQVAIDALERYKNDDPMYSLDENVQGWNEGLDTAVELLKELPSARAQGDFVNITRCRDCTYFDEDIEVYDSWCKLWGDTCSAKSYCSYAERRNDGSD